MTAGLTVGVEEEFLLVDARTRRPVSRASEVLARVPAADGFKPELYQSQLETTTDVLADLGDVGRALTASRTVLAAAAREAGTLIVPIGTPPLAGDRPRLTDGPRYRAIGETYRGVLADYETCGCHVHIGVPDRAHAVAVVDHLRPWLPTLLALSGNSAVHHGQHTGYQSWRVIQQAPLPGGGIPPRFGDLTGYDRCLARLVDSGVLVDDRMTFWAARPSAVYPTVEVRVADVAGTVDEALLQVALTRALVRTALADLDRGVEAPDVDGQLAAAALWTAARHGIHGPGVDPLTGQRVSATTLLDDLVTHVRPMLAASGDEALTEALLLRALTGETGAERQIRLAEDGLSTIVDDAVSRLLVLSLASQPDPAIS
ncbi:glutamate--cysteine ligase [Amycolatopsis sp., V23-08]|uniref:Putative glutamate--cysteine ligase 2 n=1 Tax=Amycolatopsis heterodermiae TaxID=3110235 RepID=A0ABU5R6U5_9PSEU|nr:glutamate--cysteine ligase [Amycolatopsis sp., V23-08]MEA5360996.1 glutamate--cysteine ligase [Amycolatopsis sp., V23-08]